MNELHPILVNQLRRLDIRLGAALTPQDFDKFAALISETYVESDEYRYAMERSLEIASEEIATLSKMHTEKIQKYSSLISKSVLFANKDWQLIGANEHAEKIIPKALINEPQALIQGKIIFLNLKKRPIDFQKLSDYFDCGQRFSVKNITMFANGELNNKRTINLEIVPLYKDGGLNEFALLIEDISAEYTIDLKRRVRSIIAAGFGQVEQSNLENDLKGLIDLSLDNTIYLSLMFNNKDVDLHQFYLQSMYTNFEKTTQLIDDLLGHRFKELRSDKKIYLASLIDQLQQSMQENSEFAAITLSNKLSQQHVLHHDGFETILKELLELILVQFNTFTQVDLEFISKTDSSEQCHGLIINMLLRAEHPIQQETINPLIKEAGPFFEKFNQVGFEFTEDALRVQMELFYFYGNQDQQTLHTEAQPLRILIHTKANSLLHKIINQNAAIKQVNFHLIDDEAKASTAFKNSRLEQKEFNLIFTDDKAILSEDSTFIYEIKSFIGEKFLGIYHIGNFDINLENQDEQIRIEHIGYSDFIKNYISYINRFYLKLTGINFSKKVGVLNDLRFNKDILYISLGQHTSFSFLELMITVGLVPTGVNQPEASDMPFYLNHHAVIIDFHDALTAIDAQKLDIVKHLIGKKPSLVLFNQFDKISMQFIEQQQLSSYLIKPYSLQQVIESLKELFQ